FTKSLYMVNAEKEEKMPNTPKGRILIKTPVNTNEKQKLASNLCYQNPLFNDLSPVYGFGIWHQHRRDNNIGHL
ncbi:unnamed protein product, partial [Candidula unifasciata]